MTIKYIKDIIIGDMILPSNMPNLNQILFKGDNILEFNKPNIKKINDIDKDQILMSSAFFNG